MSRKYRNIGPEALEVVEIAPLDVLREIIQKRDVDAEPAPVFDWPAVAEDEDAFRVELLKLLNGGTAEDLRPLEDRCRRIRSLSTGKGPSSLDHVAKQRLTHEQHGDYSNELDSLCRSAWAFLRHPEVFEDAEAFYGARQYRDFDKMYDAFEVDADDGIKVDAESIDAEAYISLLTAKLELPSRVSIRSLDLPKTNTRSASVMLIVRHGGPLSSVFSHKDNGMRSTIYYRPPSEATLIWTPKLKHLEICGPTPQVRKKVADCFAEVVLGRDVSSKPLTRRIFDLSRFRESLTVPLPVWDDVDVSIVRLIELELRLGNWSRRMSLRVTIDDDIEDVAQRYLGGNLILRRAEGFSRIVIAVRYTRVGDPKERSLEISFGDRRSNLHSKSDPEKRDLGYRLLNFWGILNALRELNPDELSKLLPHLLELHDLPEDEVTGGRLLQMGLDPKRLLEAGIIDLCRRQNVILIDDEDDFGDVAVGGSDQPGEVNATGRFGETLGTIPIEDVRQYIVKRDWLEEELLTVLKPLIGKTAFEPLDEDLAYLGLWRTKDAELPVYFVRRLEQPATLQKLDVTLRGRQDAGVGIVLAAGRTPFSHLGPNVIIPLADVAEHGVLDEEAQAAILHRFTAGRWLALGGTEVAMPKYEFQNAMLYIPGKIPLAVSGHKQITLLERLIAAHRSGSPEIRTGVLVEGCGVKSPADAWPSAVRKTIVDVYFENSRRAHWRLKTD